MVKSCIGLVNNYLCISSCDRVVGVSITYKHTHTHTHTHTNTHTHTQKHTQKYKKRVSDSWGTKRVYNRVR